MKYGFVFPGSDPHTAVEFAREAEAAGWDGFFVWDSVWGIDPWVTLGAVAMRTKRIRLGTMLTPLSRRRPWKLAGEAVTVDHLSNGRLILSVGLGALDTGFDKFGEATDRKVRAELLDEGLEILTGLWRGQPFNFSGKHYRIEATEFPPPPPPVQQPRIPIWVVGAWPRQKSMQRVARYDGLLPNKLNDKGQHDPNVTPDDIRAMKSFIEANHTGITPFDIVLEGETPGNDQEKAATTIRPLAEAGMTWWLESMWSTPEMDKVLARIKQGPPNE